MKVKTTRVKAFRTQKVWSKIMIGFGAASLAIGIFAVVKIIIKDSDLDWSPLLQGVQGVIFISLGVINLRNEKYYIELDDKQVRFFLSQNKQLEVINIEDIQTIEVRLFEIELQLEDQSYTLDLNTMTDDALKQVKAKFEDLQEAKTNSNLKTNSYEH